MFRFTSALALCGLLLAPAAHAEILSISAMGFAAQFPPTIGVDQPKQVNGVMVPDGATVFYAPVQFPVSGQNVCSVSLTFDDSNASEKIFAQLIRKRIVIGSTTLNPPQVMATVNSVGLAGTMQRVTTTAVSLRTIANSSNFYYVQVTAQNFNTLLVGVQIDYRPTCP